MKKVMTVTAILMVAGFAMADITIWSEDFTTPPTIQQDDLARIPFEYSQGTWVAAPSGGSGGAKMLVTASNELRMRSHDNGATRGGGIALDSSLFAGTGAGTYTLNFDIISMWNPSRLDVSVWDAQSNGAAETNAYTIDTVAGYQADLDVKYFDGMTPTTNLTGHVEYLVGDVGAAKTINFEYDGTGDVVLLLAAENTINTWHSNIVVDNLSVTTAIPEPSTLGLVGFMGGAILFIRRKLHI
jgi:hypothetical protein